MAQNDFFLSFGSDAAEFSSKLGADLGEGIGRIEALTRALAEYDAMVQRMAGGSTRNPTAGLSSGLEETASQLGRLVERIDSQFASIGQSVGSLTRGLSEAQTKLDSAARTAQQSSSRIGRTTEQDAAQNASGAQPRRYIPQSQRPSTYINPSEEVAALGRSLQPVTQQIIRQVQQGLHQTTEPAARDRLIRQAAQAFRADPVYQGYAGSGAPGARLRDLRTLIGAPASGTGAAEANASIRGGFADAQTAAARARSAGQATQAEEELASATRASTGAQDQQNAALARYAGILAQVEGAEGAVRSAQLNRIAAQADLDRLLESGTASEAQLARQIRAIEQAQRAATEAGNRPASNSVQASLFGREGLSSNLGRHVGRAIENTIAYAFIFEGFEKLKEVIENGLEAQVAFTRLKQSLDANKISAHGLQDSLASISATTATPIEHVYEAATALAGTLTTLGDLEFGTKVASQLANISHGTLTAQQAAVGLRDVVAAYGDQWAQTGISVQQGLAQTGDQITRLSQTTGVSIKDITEGTTQIAQEARDFGLNQGQASTIAAYVTKGTGETGEQAAAQTSRLLSSFYDPRVQAALIRALPQDRSTGSSTQQELQRGDLGDVITNFFRSYSNGSLSEAQKQTFGNLLGRGIQGRAYAALANGGGTVADLLQGGVGNSSGALNRANTAYLGTVAGQVKKLDEDFQNLGQSMQRVGAFDGLLVVAKTADIAFQAVNQLFKLFDSFERINPIIGDFVKFGVVIGELGLAWRLLGGTVTKALGAMNIVNVERSAAEAGSVLQVGRTSIVRNAGVVGAQGAAAAAGTRAAQQDVIRAGERASIGQIGAGLAGAGGAGFLRLRNIFATTPTGSFRERANVALANQIGIGGAQSLGGTNASGGLFGIGGRSRATTAAQQEALDKARQETSQALVAAEERLAAVTAEASAAIGGFDAGVAEEVQVFQTTMAELAASGDEVATAFQRAAVAANEAAVADEEAAAAAASGGGGRGGSGLALLGAAGVALFAFSRLQAGGHRAEQADQARSALINNVNDTNQNDIRTATYQNDRGVNDFQDFLTGRSSSTLGQLGNLGRNVGEGAADFFGARFDGGTRGSARAFGRAGGIYDAFADTVYRGDRQGGALQLAGADPAQSVSDRVKAVNDYATKERAQLQSQKSAALQAAGSDKQNQALIAANFNQLEKALDDAVTHRIAAINSLSNQDVLTPAQVSQLASLTPTFAQFNRTSLQQNAAGLQVLANSIGLTPGSTAARDVQSQLGAPSLRGRLQAQVGSDSEVIRNASVYLQDTGNDPSSEAYKQEQQALQQALQDQQQARLQLQQNAIQTSTGAAGLNETQGSYGSAINNLRGANTQLLQYLQTLDSTDPNYYATLQQVQDNKNKIAELQVTGANQGLALQAAQTSNPLLQAQLALRQTQNSLRATQQSITTPGSPAGQLGLGPNGRIGSYNAQGVFAPTSDYIDPAQAHGLQNLTAPTSSKNPAYQQLQIQQAAQQVAIHQQQEAIVEAQAAAAIAPVRNQTLQAQLQLNEARREEGVYSSGTLKDDTKLAQLKGQEAQLNIQIADSVQAAVQAVYDITIAQQKAQGNDVAAAQTELNKALSQYNYAVAQYGADSEQARSAYVTVVTDTAAKLDAELGRQNSALDLQIAQLNARGASGDAQRAAADEVRKAQNAIREYRAKGGQSGTATFNQLQAQLVTAQRSQFDVALNAQLDTLDFQKQTYQITGAQEVAALQQILKNKQLTLAEQRSITLKIKDLQTSIRQQLTAGGLNIPSDIKLPTAYDVRRSLGAGFSGAGTSAHSSTLNDNRVVTARIYQTLPTAALASAVADALIGKLNAQTGQSVRANSVTPRLVKV